MADTIRVGAGCLNQLPEIPGLLKISVNLLDVRGQRVDIELLVNCVAQRLTDSEW